MRGELQDYFAGGWLQGFRRGDLRTVEPQRIRGFQYPARTPKDSTTPTDVTKRVSNYHYLEAGPP